MRNPPGTERIILLFSFMSKAKAVAAGLLLAITLLVVGRFAYATAHRKHAQRHRRKATRRTHTTRQRATGRHSGANAVYTVTATAYQAVASQTDSEPFVTADNTTIRRGYSSRLRWLAVSRDLLRQGGGSIQYGDKVRVRGVSPRLDGVYTVHDTMHKRHRHRIDILSNPQEKLALSTKNVQLRVVRTAPRRQPAQVAARRTSRSQHLASRSAHHQRGRAERAPYLVSAIL